MQWEQKSVNSELKYKDWKALCSERIPKPSSVWKKAGLVEISLTPGNINSILVQGVRTC